MMNPHCHQEGYNTWKSPVDTARNQIQYAIIGKRLRNTVKAAKTYAGADVNFNHNLW